MNRPRDTPPDQRGVLFFVFPARVAVGIEKARTVRPRWSNLTAASHGFQEQFVCIDKTRAQVCEFVLFGPFLFMAGITPTAGPMTTSFPAPITMPLSAVPTAAPIAAPMPAPRGIAFPVAGPEWWSFSMVGWLFDVITSVLLEQFVDLGQMEIINGCDGPGMRS